jgi:DedD protein
MTDSAKKTYYQVSFTGMQALVGLAGILAALALAFFLGAKAGFEKSSPALPAQASVVPPGETDSSATSPAAPTSTTLSAPATVAPAVAAATPSTSGASAAPASPQEAPVFEDREAGISGEKAPSRTEIAGETSGAPLAAPAGKSAPEKQAAGYYVQILSTTSKAEASRWKGKLSAKKYRPALSAVDSSKGKMYRVRLGPYPDKEQAKKLAAKISTEFHKAAWVAPAQ